MSDSAWREYWSGGSDATAAIEGAKAARLADFWRGLFASCRAEGPGLIVDIAAGAGSALAVADEMLHEGGLASRALLALDISAGALRTMTRRLKAALGAACSSDALPLGDSSAGVIISQFGIEYAGRPAFAEAARILSPEGIFCSISHYAGGGIEAECAENARLLDATYDAELLKRARTALARSYLLQRENRAPDAGGAEESAFAEAFRSVERSVGDAPESAAKRMLERLLADLSQLAVRRLAYDERDALGWLDGMDNSLSAYRGRMASMTAAALDSQQIGDIGDIFKARGFSRFEASPLRLADAGAPAAWVIRAEAGNRAR